MVPELDANRVRKWAHEKTPPEYREEMRVEVDETPRGLTIFDCRPPWSDLIGPEWTRTPIARLGYMDYAVVETIFTMERPVLEELTPPPDVRAQPASRSA